MRTSRKTFPFESPLEMFSCPALISSLNKGQFNFEGERINIWVHHFFGQRDQTLGAYLFLRFPIDSDKTEVFKSLKTVSNRANHVLV